MFQGREVGRRQGVVRCEARRGSSSRAGPVPTGPAVALIAAAVAVACGGKPAPSAPPTVDATGATITGVDGAAVAVAPGAVDGPVTIRIARDSGGAAALPVGSVPAGPVYALTPHGIRFERPAAVRIPFDPATRPEVDAVPMLLKASPGGGWVALSGTPRDGDALVADVDSFSYFVVQWCRPAYAANGPQHACMYAGRDATLSVVSPAPAPAPPAPPGLLQPVDLALRVTRPTLLALRATLEVRDAADIPNHVVHYRIVSDTGAVAGSGAFPSDEWKAAGSIKTFDAAVALTESSNGIRSFRVELSCSDDGFNRGCTGRTATGSFGSPPEVPPYTVLSAPVLVSVAISPGTPPDASMLPLLDPNTSGFALPAGAGGGVTSSWTRPVLGGPSQFITLQANTAQPLSHRWEVSDDGGLTWADWRRPETDDPTACRSTPALCFPYGYTPGVDGVRHSERTLCVDLPHSPCPSGIATYSNWPFVPGTAINGMSFRVVASNAYGTVTGPAWTFAAPLIGVPPTITAQPAFIRVVSGETASFTVVASGAPAPTYQWQRLAPGGTWQDVAGATAATYTTAPLAPADSSTSYRVKVTNSEGAVTSEPAAVIVDTGAVAPSIAAQPLGLSVISGSEAVLAVVADGSAPLSFQWRKDGVDLVGANAPMLKLTAVSTADAGAYTVRVSNAAGSVVSEAATLAVGPGSPTGAAPSVVTPPSSVIVAEGNSVSFAVGASGSGPLSYEWLKDGVAIAGATAAVYTIASATPGDAGAYSVVVSNGLGAATSPAATLTVTPAAGPVAPTITTEPTGAVAIPGEAVTLAVAATGTGPLSYQWRKDGVTIPGASRSVFTLSSVTGLDAGTYSVVVSNAAGSATSAGAVLRVLAAPSITAQPRPASVVEGSSASFSVSASGEALRYLWLRNQQPIVGATSPTYTTPPATLADAGAVFSVLVYNNAGAVFSEGVVLDVLPASPAGLCTSADPTGWCWIQPAPHANGLGALAFDGGSTFALGRRTAMRSDDGGATWQTSFFALDVHWYDLASPSSGVLVGAGREESLGLEQGVYRSTDGGRTWTKVLPEEVYSVAFTNGAEGVAVGRGIWRTTDGGATWSVVQPPSTAFQLVRVTSPAPSVYVAIGSAVATPAMIMRSVDGGATWASPEPGTTTQLTDVAFGSATTGVIVTASGDALRTTDGGATWAAPTAVTPNGLETVAFADASTVVALGGQGATFRSSDAGLTWTAGEDLAFAGATFLPRLGFSSATVGHAVGLFGQIWRTTDAGLSFQLVAGGSDLVRYSAVRFGHGVGLAVDAPSVRWTGDLGASWSELASLPTFPQDAALLDGSTYVTAGRSGLSRTTDGGLSWSTVHALGNEEGLLALDFVPSAATPTVGVAVGYALSGAGGLVLRTTDGGLSWSPVTIGAVPRLSAVTFSPYLPDLGIAAGHQGTVLRTTDGGATWTAVIDPGFDPNDAISAVRFGPSAALATTLDGLVYRSADGGQTWTQVFASQRGSMTGVAFTAASEAVAVGLEGVIVRSADAGVTWTLVDVPITVQLNAVAHTGTGSEVVAVGEAGTILRNLRGGAP